MIPSLPKVEKDGVLTIHTTPQNRLGEYFCDNKSNALWVYLRANSALNRGMPLVSIPPNTDVGGDATNGVAAAIAGSRRLTFQGNINLNTSFPRVPNQPRDAEYMIVRDITNDQIGTVHAHEQQAMDVEWWSEDDLSLTTALSAGDDLQVITPWLVTHADGNAGSDGIIAFAQKAIPQGSYFWGLVEGIGIGLAAAAITAGVGLQVSDAGDGLEPVAEAGTTVSHRVAYTFAAAADGDEFAILASAPARISIPPFQGGRSRISYEHPSE